MILMVKEELNKEKLKREYECFGMPNHFDEERCKGCPLIDECRVQCKISMEEWGYQAEWDRLHEPPEDDEEAKEK